MDSNGNIFVSVFSGTLIPIFNALQPIPALENPNFPCHQCGQSDGFIMKIAPTNAPAAALVPAYINFAVGQPVLPSGMPNNPASVNIVNMSSTSTLTVADASLTGDFCIQNGCSTVAPASGTCAIQVDFTPTAAGTRTGVLSITDNSAVNNLRSRKVSGPVVWIQRFTADATMLFGGNECNSGTVVPHLFTHLVNGGGLLI